MNSDLVLRWGIVSAGLISQDFCTALLSLKSKKHVIQAVAARNIEDAKKFAQKFNIPNYYDSYEKLNEDKDVNIIYVGAVNSAHKEITLKAILAKKHCICEKPMSLNLKEQEEILAASKKNNVFFMEALWTRFFPVIDKLKEEINNNSIGRVNFFSGNFMVPIKDVERLKKKELGGGAIYDIGIYPIQLACLVFNHEKPIKITATGHLMPSGVDECCTIVLLYPENRIAQINVSTNCTMFAPSFIVGEKGYLQIPKYSWCPTELILPNGETYIGKLPDFEKKDYNFDNSVGLRFQAEAAYDAISKGLIEHPNVTHDNSRLIMQIIDESRKQLGYVLPTD